MTIIVIIIVVVMIIIQKLGYQDMIVRHEQITSLKIQSPVKIMMLSDLHGTIYGYKQRRLLQSIYQQKPDVIVFVGDMVDERCDLKGLEDLLMGLLDFPCYYVLGNHELRCDLDKITLLMEKYSVHAIGQKYNEIMIGQSTLMIAGMDDPLQMILEGQRRQWELQLQELSEQVNHQTYTVLLSHRPSFVLSYQQSHFDLVLAGHAHGGQWRIPYLLNGVFAPDEGLLPRYAGGHYLLEHTHLIVGRGLVKNFIPRFFNPPELVVIELLPLTKE